MKIRSPDRSIIMPGSSTLSFYYIFFLPPSVLELALHISILPPPPPLEFFIHQPIHPPTRSTFSQLPIQERSSLFGCCGVGPPHIRWIRGFRVWVANWQSPSVLDIFTLVSFGQSCCSSTLTKLISLTSAQTPLENVEYWKSKLSTYRLLALEVFLFYFYFYV